ncbi:FGGY-family carbohydrate kinase [Novosphingobium humi]|uniref:FGGY family carbohydrate kinase n=1 Tax=Novosphingobium humi TaxID=2282397 RepID=A0ABY7TUW5_9SPHN|nr:FGGY family carbohydrate kinase [Novosphingobium humi]WCT76806.1 FGGY family carbohydrate kinase [Novosphingobium humi]
MIDVGKTMSKITLWSRDGQLLDRQVRPNEKCEEGGIARLDAAGIAAWATGVLGGHANSGVEYIVPVGHGAGFAAIIDGALAFAPLDYEAAPPQSAMDAYRAARSPFAQTGSPALPQGLNFGAHVWWADRLYPDAMARATLVPWAQYWAWWLSGVAVSEVTSLGCHSDLWSPDAADWSDLAKGQGWDRRFAPVVKAGDVLGPISPALAAATGLPATVKVLAGLHDSNAALMAARGFAEIARNEATVLSTGTWFIAMRLPAAPIATADLPEARAILPEGRDCLVNVDAYGRPVPSARFMGGREIEALIEIDTRRVDIKPDQPLLLAAVPAVLAKGAMHMPTLAPGCGPYPDAKGEWVNQPEDWYERRAGACLYAALVADQALDLIGSDERLLVEGRFAEAEVFVRALAALRPKTQVYVGSAHNDVSFGAIRLIDPALMPEGTLRRIEPLDADLDTYRNRWLARLEMPKESNA